MPTLRSRRPPSGFELLAGPAGTLWSFGLTAAFTVLATICVNPPFGLTPLWPGILPYLRVDEQTLTQLRLTALAINSFIERSSDPGSLLVPILFVAILRADDVMAKASQRPLHFFGGLAAMLLFTGLVDAYLLPGAWGLFGALFMILLLGRPTERMFGTRAFLRYSLAVLVLTNVLAALLLLAAPRAYSAAVGSQSGVPLGMGPVFGAWIMAFAVYIGDGRSSGLRLTGRQLIWVLVAMDLYTIVFVSVVVGVTHIAGLAIGWYLLRGRGNLSNIIDRWRLWRLQQRRARFSVVQGGKGSGRSSPGDRSGGQPSPGDRSGGQTVHREALN